MAQEKEGFLGRWSRLKREQAEQPLAQPQKSEALDKPPELPPIDQLTPESEFSGFMHPKVADALRRAALKKMFADPHFNIPDPFEPYSGDWTVAEPLTSEVVASLNQARSVLFSGEERAQALAADVAKAEEEAYAHEEKRQREAKEDEPGRQDA